MIIFYSIHISIEINIFDINIAHNESDGEEAHEDDDGNVSG